MTSPRILGAIVCVFLVTWATDFVIHGVILVPDYKASMPMWRSEGDMMSHMQWLFVGQMLSAVTMTLVYSRGFAGRRSLADACLFGLLMGIFSQSFTPILYAVQPLPVDLAIKWVALGVLQAIILGLVLYAVCRPRAAVAEPA